MAESTKNYGLRKDSQEDFYNVDVFNDNFDKIDSELKKVEIEAKNKNGGNADTVDGKHADDFAEKNHTHILSELLNNENFYSAKKIEYSLSRIIDDVSGFDNDGFVVTSDNYLVYLYFERYYSGTVPDGYRTDAVVYYSYIENCTLYCRKQVFDIFTAGSMEAGESYDNSRLVYYKAYDLSKALRHTHDNAEISKAGFMSSADKTKLDGIETGANKIVVDSVLNGVSSNPVQNKVINEALLGKANKEHIHNANELEGFPASLPANGGNADTVEGKTAEELQNYNNLTNKPSSLPANGGNADTVDGKHASDLQNYNNLTNKPSSLPADGGIADGIKIPNDGGYTTDQYGNFRHNSDNTQNTWNIVSGEGANKFSVNFENGNASTFGTIKAASFSGDGSGITNVNAKTVMNRNIEEIQTRDRGYSFCSANKDWNDITVPGYYGLMHSTSSALHNPVNGTFFYPFVFKYADDAMTQLAIPHISGNKDDRGLIYIRSKNPSYNGWSDWKALGETNQYEKTFFSSAESWYRLAKGKLHNNSDNTGACGIMTIMADSSSYRSSDVISVAQNGFNGEFSILNHSRYNQFFKKFRMAQGTDGYMYIDGYTEIKGDSVKFTFTFSGIGWKVCENIVSVNSGFGNVIMTKEPILN